jgi:altronate dehydratase large subunit
VALALVQLSPGTPVEVGSRLVQIRDAVPYGHKFALEAIPLGAQLIKYGQPIGRSTQPVAQGAHVHVHNLASAYKLGQINEIELQESSSLPRAVPAGTLLSKAEFLGFRRRDGRVGVRNHTLVLATVHCANGVVERIGRLVPEVVALPHVYGCGQLGEDLAQTRRVLEAYANHPNVGAVLLIGLGCETMPTVEMSHELREQGVTLQHLLIQEVGGSRAAVERGVSLARELLQEAAGARREPVPVSKLMVGVECGGSDAWSGVTANPAVGVAADLLVALGGTVVLSEVTEFIGAERLLAARAASPEVAQRILAAVARREAVTKELGVDLRGAQPSPGNMAGGLTTIEEKSLGAIAKGGTAPVREFLAYGQRPTAQGLVVMDTAGNDLESVTAMVAGGAQVILFTTGRGSPVGNPIAPVIKVASNTPVYKRLLDDMDLNAGTVIAGEPLNEVGRRIFELLLAVAEGTSTAAEQWGHREFAIEPRGPKV